jgi:hypothetical protein
MAMLEGEPAAWPQVSACTGHDLAEGLESIHTSEKGERRFEAQIPFLKAGMSQRDVRRIGEDQVKGRLFECFIPTPVAEGDSM